MASGDVLWEYIGPESGVDFEGQSIDPFQVNEISPEHQPTSDMIERFALTCEKLGLLRRISNEAIE